MNLKGGHTFTYQNTQYYSTKGRKLCLLMTNITKPKQSFLFLVGFSHTFSFSVKNVKSWDDVSHSQSQPVTLKKREKILCRKKTAKNMNSFIKGIVTFGLTIF